MIAKQHGPLLYTVTLLPGEKVTLYHSDRYRRVTTEEQRYSVQTTFMQFVSMIHQAKSSGSTDALNQSLANMQIAGKEAGGWGINLGIINIGSTDASAAQLDASNFAQLSTHSAFENFAQTIEQASQLTQAERSLVVSAYEDSESQNVTCRTLVNDNPCSAVTYFVRKVMEVYELSTVVSGISFRFAQLTDWRSVTDMNGLPAATQAYIRKLMESLPKIGEKVDHPRTIYLPSDGAVYDPELAHCCSCDPEREASLRADIEHREAEAKKIAMEAALLQAELERRRKLLEKGDLSPFEPAAALPGSG